MTSEKSYSAPLTKVITDYKNMYLTPLNKYRVQEPPADVLKLESESDLTDTSAQADQRRKAVLMQVSNLVNVTTRNLQQIRQVKIPPISFDPTKDINAHFDALEKTEQDKKASFELQAQTEKKRLTDEYNQAKVQADEFNSHLTDKVKEKHALLLEYKDSMKPIFKKYEITPLDLTFEEYDEEKFCALIDSTIEFCDSYIAKQDNDRIKNVFESIRSISNVYQLVGVSVAVVAVAFIALPILFPYMVYSLVKGYNSGTDNIERLRMACRLMATVDYNRMINPDDIKTVDDLDVTEVDTELQSNMETIIDYTEERAKALESVNADIPEIQRLLADTQADVRHQYDELISSLTSLQSRAQAKEAQLKSVIKMFPSVQNDSVVMSHDYVLSRNAAGLDIITKAPCCNIIFDDSRRAESLDIMKLYLCNALLSVRVKQLTIEIYDPKNMGGDFTEFVTPETKPYIKINETELSKMLTTYRSYAQSNVLALNKMKIDDYNADAEKRELVPKDYRLLILISDFKDLQEGKNSEQWFEFVKFSAEQGVMIWILGKNIYQNVAWISGYTWSNPIKYSVELGERTIKTYTAALANYKDRGIDYITKFANTYIPKEKWWTFDTISGIKMPYGLENGDPTRGLNVAPELGDGNVHALLGGATGAGKSAAINQLLISLITMYPPSELLIVYIDFKNVEAAKFTAGYDPVKGDWMPKDEEEALRKDGKYYLRMSRIPHLKIISGTTDGEYALSVFEYLMAEMAHRQELINKYGVTKIQSMRESILQNYNKEHNGDPKKGTWADMRKDWEWYKPNVYDVYGDLPRLLVIFDEFQVMYNPEFVDNRTIDQINGKITAFTKLARAMSAHFWFTSQSMKGTMSKDTMANFSLRGALRCTAEVSEELLGNPAAGTIKAKFGFMYTNDSAGQDKNANRLWRVPFLDDKHKPDDTREFRDMFDYVDKVNELLEPFNEKSYMAEFYDEKVLVPATVLENWYVTYPDTFAESRAFILGERANYSTNKAPVTMTLQDDANENILLAAFDRDDMLNLTMTLIKNLQLSHGDDFDLIMSVYDPESYVMLDVENIVDDAFLALASPRQDPKTLVDALNSMVDARNEKGGPFKPMYVFCVQWERAEGIGADTDFRLTDKLKAVMRAAPSVGIHFVMCCKDKMDLPRSIPQTCNHRIGAMLPKDGNFFIETPKVEKLPDKAKDAGLFAFYEFGTSLSKFRIYQHTFTKKVKSREIVI